MADGDGEAVGGGVGTRCLRQPQQRPDHLLDLALIRPSVGGYGLLHLKRRVLGDLYPGSVRREEGNPPRAWPTLIPVVTLVLKKSSSTATAWGL